METQFIKLLVIFAVIMVLVLLKRSLFESILAAMAVTVLLFGIPLVTAGEIAFRSLYEWNTVMLIINFTMIIFLQRIMEYKFTRYPVCRESKDLIIGFVHVKDLYLTPQDNRDVSKLNIRPITAVPEGLSVAKLISAFQEKRTKIAVVVDEFGGTAGIVTMSDIMDEIVGESDDEYRHDFEEEVKTLKEGVYRIDGSVPMDEVVELIGFEPEEADEYTTAGGLLLSLFDRIPETGDRTSISDPADSETNVQFMVVDMDNLRIDKIQVTLANES